VSSFSKIALLVIGGALMRIKPPPWMIRRLLLSRDTSMEEVGAVRQAIGTVNGKVLATRLRMILRCDVDGLLANINVATLVIGAEKDRLIRRTVTDKMSGIPNSELVWIDSPHLALFSRPREIWEMIRARKSFEVTATNT
jgi:pimeloyl-ACP methyl ester carboxylesterase